MESQTGGEVISENGTQERFDWQLYEKQEGYQVDLVVNFLKGNQMAFELARRIEDHTSTRFFDWVDHMVFSEEKFDIQDIILLGYKEKKELELPSETRMYNIPGSNLFPILIHPDETNELFIRPESIRDFQRTWSLRSEIEGTENAPYNTLEISRQNNRLLLACERRGYDGFVVKEPSDLDDYLGALDFFSTRKRETIKDLTVLEECISKYSSNLVSGRLADAFFKAERQFWIDKNRAGRHQRRLQDDIGLGWANRDHQAFRCSRGNFSRIVRIFESLGMRPRERFYAGAQAGWGAQVLEHPVTKEAIFADVDLEPEESVGDFAHDGLPPRRELGTVGLWVGLHGESILSAGLHHLAVLVDYEKSSQMLPSQDVGVMSPFSSFPFLKQAFTEGHIWNLDRGRLDTLLEDGSIDREQYSLFSSQGAIGGHVEIIERNYGFKGFNQDSVSAIIKATDPRTQHGKRV